MASADKRKHSEGGDGPRKKSKLATTNAPRRITRLMTTDAPRRAVFTTAELLENIMLSLPPKVVIGAQRTCRQFRDIVKTSMKIQEHVFLRGVPNDVAEWEVQERYGYRSAFLKMVPFGTSPDQQVARARPIILHPMLRSLNARIETNGSHIVRQIADIVLPQRSRLIGSESWRQMSLTRPIITTATICVCWRISSVAQGYVRRTVQHSDGVTLGELIDAVAYGQYSTQASLCIVKVNDKWAYKSFDGDERSVKDVVEQLERDTGCQAQWYTTCDVQLEGVIAPMAYEWKQILDCAESDKV